MTEWKTVNESLGFLDALVIREMWKNRGYKTRLRACPTWKVFHRLLWRIQIKEIEQ